MATTISKIDKAEKKRQKHMFLLMRLYERLITEPNAWTMPYCFTIHYTKPQSRNPRQIHCDADVLLYTDNVAFAAMIYTGIKLQKTRTRIHILAINLNGLETEFTKMVKK